MRVLSGIQPTARFHWGNYFGAIQQYIALQGNEQAFYFIADLHALTSVRDPKLLRQNIWDAALDLLALGLDPNQAALFRQSDVPEVTELTWLLMTVTQFSLLEKCTSYKDKVAKGIAADAGLFTHPVLVAADILLYDTRCRPRSVRIRFSTWKSLAISLSDSTYTYGLAKMPASSDGQRAGRWVQKVPLGTDGEKMSKSYGNSDRKLRT